MKKVLITGGAGFIGSEIIKQLSTQKEWEITVLDSMTKQIHGENWRESYLYQSISDKCHFIKGDIRDLSTVAEAVGENEYIIHLAAETGTGQSMYQINQYNEVNIMGTSNIFQAIMDSGKKTEVKKIILASSRAVYGEGRYRCPACGIVHPISRKRKDMEQGDFNMYCEACGEKLVCLATPEDSVLRPSSAYAFTKLAQEDMVTTLCPALGIDYTIFRFQNVYGVGQSLHNPYTGILSIFSTLFLEDKPINIFEDGLESRDFINVIDIGAGVIKSLTVPESNSQTINLGSGVGTSVIEVADQLKEIYHSNSMIHVTGDFRVGDIANNFADIQRARDILDFQQTISFESGLTEFCNWVIHSKSHSNCYENSLLEMEHKGMFFRKSV